MKKTLLLLFIIFLKIIPFNVYSECHLKDREVSYRLALLEGPKERVLKQFAIYCGCPDDRATTIAKYLMNPSSDESEKWAKLFLHENWSYDYELLASAYIEGINRNPPVESISSILFEYQIPFVNQPREYSNFSMNLPGTCGNSSYPVRELPPRYRDYILKGLKCQLTREEADDLLCIIKEIIETNPDFKRTPNLYLVTLIRSYFNQTGDLEFFQYLWDREGEDGCLQIAEIANDPEIVKLALDLTWDLDKTRGNERGDMKRMLMLGIFHEQKDVPEVGDRVRQLVKKPGLYYNYFGTLISILGDRGWNQRQYYANKSTIEEYKKHHDGMTNVVNNTLNMIDLRIRIKNENEQE